MLLSLATFAGAALGCGDGSTSERAAQRTSTLAAAPSLTAAAHPDSDGDHDRNDDEGLAGNDMSHKAASTEARAVAALVHRYYAAAAAADGASACPLLVATLARLAASHSKSFGPSYLRGRGCAHILSQLFRHMHADLVSDASTMRVVEVRVEGPHGFAVLHTRRRLLSKLLVQREAESWRVASLLATQ